jgi:hypothetical protein
MFNRIGAGILNTPDIDPPAAYVRFQATILTLKLAGLGAADDYCVLDANRREIGRIMLHPQAPSGQPWFWTITGRLPSTTADRGYAESREDAMAAFKKAWGSAV